MGDLEKTTIKWLTTGLLVAEPLHMALTLSGWFTGLLPQSLQQADKAPPPIPAFLIPVSILGSILIVCLIIGLVGLLLYKWWGKLLYTVFWGGNLIFLPLLPPEIKPSVEVAFSELKLLASGALLALIWFSSARKLYARNNA